MQTVFTYIYLAVRMFYAFRRPHVKGSDIHFMHTQTINRPHLPNSPNTRQPPLPFQTATLARPPYFFTLAEKPSHCFHSCPKGRLKKHLMLKK